ncbi:hypothetical protein B0H16DRAFT_1742581 [Mycena metata]|uniref:Uncharacterized protein n=1 Tax=Mycena metata TaxID=1033252 RepID=A0AAD7MF22_9AGAR|nr:hypothetical protein B0H16DRAFT_1742581 [Mycena metata]
MRPSLPADLCWEIGLLSTSATRARLLAVSRQTYILLVPLLYRDISVADNAHALVHTLATSPDLAFLVKSLKFRDSRYATVNHSEWAVALPQLVNLRVLTTSYYIPLDANVIPKITFRLWSFTAFTVVTGAWARFLATQNHLQDLILHSDFMGPVPTPQMLPNLRRLKARYYDVSKFGQHSGLTNIWFYLADPTSGPALSTRVITALSRTTARPTTLRVNGPQMLMILDRTPGLMEKVHHLTLDEDRGWCRFTANAAVLRIAVALDHRLPSLETLTMVSCYEWTGRMFDVEGKLDPPQVAVGKFFAHEMRCILTALQLDTYHFCGLDGCVTFKNWRKVEPVVMVMEPEDHGAWFEIPEYAI